jgi:hypothetical protein
METRMRQQNIIHPNLTQKILLFDARLFLLTVPISVADGENLVTNFIANYMFLIVNGF